MAPEINLIDFFQYFKGTVEQKEAVQLLQSAMPDTLLRNGSLWVVKYREQPPKPDGYFTPAMFEDLTGYAANKFPQSFCDDCNLLFRDTGFTDLNAAQMLMANLMHETGNFRWLKELASGEAYNNRSDLGNGPNDGPIYKGAGVLMLTGKHNYSRFADDIDDPRVMEGVDYVAETYPFRSAATWIVENGLLNLAKRGEFEAVCVRINGGHNGYADRCAKYAICQDVMK
jgi:predicted chitinase